MLLVLAILACRATTVIETVPTSVQASRAPRPAVRRVSFDVEELSEPEAEVPTPECYSASESLTNICESTIEKAPAIVPTRFVVLRTCSTCASSRVSLGEFHVDLESVGGLLVKRLSEAGHTIAFRGLSANELLVTTVPAPAPQALPRKYYQVRVLSQETSFDTFLLLDASVVILKPGNGAGGIDRFVQIDEFGASLENEVLRLLRNSAPRRERR